MKAMEAGLHGVHHPVQIREYLVPHIILADVVPDVLGGIQVGTVGRQRYQGHVGRNDEFVRLVPTCAIQEHHAVFAWKLCGGLSQKQGHQLGIDPGEDQGNHLPVLRAHRNVGVDVFADDLASDGRSKWERGPAAPPIADPPETAFVLEQDPKGFSLRKAAGYGFERFQEFFLKAAAAAGSCLAWWGRGVSFRHSWRCNSL